MSRTITELLDEIHQEAEEAGYNPTLVGVDDDEDLQAFALRFLLSNLDEALEHTIWCSDHDTALVDCPPHKENKGPSCTKCGALSYYKHKDGLNYCLNHLPFPPPVIINIALLEYLKHYAEHIEDSWYTLTKSWDLNIYLSENEVLCATVYPVENGSPDTSRPYPLVVDPSTATVYPYIVEV